MTPAMTKMVKCRTGLIMEQRFFGSLALKLQLKEDPTCPTMWTDGVSLGFSPDWVSSLSMEETKAWICHEVMHCANGHHTRRQGRDFEDWNIATDYAINDIITNAGLHLSEGHLHNPQFANKSADTIYSEVHGKRKKEGGDNQSQQQGNGGKDSPSNGQPQPGQGNGQGKPTKGQCGEVRDFPGEAGPATGSENKKEAEQWKIAMASAANAAKSCGQLPGGLEDLVKEMLEPKVPWREMLQRFVEQVSKNDYTWTRPNPRYVGQGVILPSLHNKELNPIDIWIDTSGSVGPEEKQQFFGEIDDIRRHYQTTIRIVYCDTKVREVVTLEKEDILTELSMKGGGGTRFSPAIAWSEEQEDKPCCGIYLTDMQCSDFGKEPSFPVLWVQTQGKKKEAPFGELVHMNPNNF